MSNNINRRDFLNIGAVATTGLIVGCSLAGDKKRTMKAKNFVDQAPDGKILKAGLIGCGGRGTGAAINFLNAGPNLKIHALGDVFQDRIDSCKKKLMDEKALQLLKENPEKAKELLTQFGIQWGNKVVQEAWDLGDLLWTKYDEKF